MTTITGRQIRDESITGDDVRDGSLELKDLSETALTELTALIAQRLSAVATTGAYADLIGTPKLGLDPSA